MKHKNYIFWVWLFAVVAVAGVMLAWAVIIKDGLPDRSTFNPVVMADKTIVSSAADYSFSLPTSWYVEKNGMGDDMTIYPDYDPAVASTSLCKIEISSFPIPNTSVADFNLDEWVTENLHADPTGEVDEISRTPLEIDTSLGIEWNGALNGVSTTLAYATTPTGHTVLEIAPSIISKSGTATNDDCDSYLQIFLSDLKLETESSQ